MGVALLLLSFFCLLILQFFKIQVIEHDKWAAQASAQHQTVITEPFKRGAFYSNTAVKAGHPQEAQPLVIDVLKFHLHIDPDNLPEKLRSEIATKLSLFCGWSESERHHAFEQFNRKSRNRRVQSWLPGEKKEEIQSWWLAFARQHKIARNALFFVQDYQRSYPFGHLLGQVLHTVRDQRDEKTDQSISTGGLELVFDSMLQGKTGKRRIHRSARHAMEMGDVLQPPEDGADITLTINHYLQAIAEEEIESQVKAIGAKGGWALMMEPRTGAVLALAQYPFFEPKNYRDYFNDPKRLEDTKVKAVTDLYEPGSVMKPITLAICLLANKELERQGKPPLFDPEEMLDVSPGPLPGRLKPIRDPRNHSFMNMEMALQKSSNVYMAKMIARVVEELGAQWYRGVLQNIFGFGMHTGIELPGESAGVLPTPGKMHPNGTLEWSLPTPYSLSMGYNILVNNVQMARCFAIIANGGYDVKPTLVEKITKPLPGGGEKILYQREEGLGDRLLPSNVTTPLIRAMKYVTKAGGAAPKADIFGYTEAGKTGTSEKIINGAYSKRDHISTFIGFAPANNPRFVLMIVIDEPPFAYIPGFGSYKWGGNCAAPVFRRIGLRSLQYLGVPPDDPYGYPVGDPRRKADKADWVKEAEEIKERYNQWNPA
jgi:cell division protein FtsI (penicillin-binding protein 3)